MVDVSQLIAIFNSLFNWLKRAADDRARHDQAFSDALLRVYVACSETKSYLRGLKLRKHRDLEREGLLSRLWNEAAVALRGIDRELADQCLLQGSLLADALSWTEAQVDAARESLDKLFQRARALL